MHILLVEDDAQQSQTICESLYAAFPEARIETLATELQFRQRVDTIASNRPDIVILDVMLRWTDPSPQLVPKPVELKNTTFHKAGFRCQELLQEHPETKDLPVILFTVIDETDAKLGAPSVIFVAKFRDQVSLIEKIKELTRLDSSAKVVASP